jgi:mRNA interferase MazF
MGPFAVGSVVLIHFPFSDLSSSKLRPALLLADAGNHDWVCAQITSRHYADKRAVLLETIDFVEGSRRYRVLFVRLNYLQQANLCFKDRLVGFQKLS